MLIVVSTANDRTQSDEAGAICCKLQPITPGVLRILAVAWSYFLLNFAQNNWTGA